MGLLFQQTCRSTFQRVIKWAGKYFNISLRFISVLYCDIRILLKIPGKYRGYNSTLN